MPQLAILSQGENLEETTSRLKMSDGFGLFARHWRSDQESAKVVVCIHGIEAHSGAFALLGRELARDATMVHAFDRRGFGESKEPDLPRGDTHSFARHLSDIDEVIQAYRPQTKGQKILLMAHSVGCAYALWYAAEHGESIDGMILAAPPAQVGFKVPAKDAIKFPFLKLLRPHSMYNLLGIWPQAFRQSEEFKIVIQDPLCTAVFGVGWLLSLQTKLANRILKNATRTTVPTLIIQGGADIIALPAGARKVMDSLATKDKTLKTFDDADHWFYHAIIPRPSGTHSDQRRAEVSSVVLDWIRRH